MCIYVFRYAKNYKVNYFHGNLEKTAGTEKGFSFQFYIIGKVGYRVLSDTDLLSPLCCPGLFFLRLVYGFDNVTAEFADLPFF